jgi:RNA polymerase sigma-70 factor (ECF subfamily)
MDAIIGRWQRPLFAFAWRYLHHNADAEDAVIETFVRLNEQRTKLPPDSNLAGWLFTALANRCHNQQRWRRRHPEFGGSSLGSESGAEAAMRSAQGAGTHGLESDECAHAVREAIEHLPHDQRVVVLLHHYERMSYRAIAGVVGCSERGVETRLYRAREHLRTELAPLLTEIAG